MRSKFILGAVFVALLSIFAMVELWPDDATLPTPPTSVGKGAPDAAPSWAVEANRASPAAPATPAPAETPTGQGAIQIAVRAPATVQQGQSFQVVVDLDARGGIRKLALSLTYDQHVLQLLGCAEGTFVRQWGTAADLTAEEPRDGYVLLKLDVNNNQTLAGAGSLAILQFQALLKPGTSPLTIGEITVAEKGPPGPSTTPVVRQGLIKVE